MLRPNQRRIVAAFGFFLPKIADQFRAGGGAVCREACRSSGKPAHLEFPLILCAFYRLRGDNGIGKKEIPVAAPTIDLRVNPSDETIHLGPLAVRFLLTGSDSAGTIAAFQVMVPGAQRLAAPAHSHDGFEETIYGVEGVLTWTVDGRPIDVGPGQALCIPRGAVHRFDNNTTHAATVLCLVTPAAIGPGFFREAAEVMNATPDGPPDRVRMAEVMLRHGLTPAPAPAAVAVQT